MPRVLHVVPTDRITWLLLRRRLTEPSANARQVQLGVQLVEGQTAGKAKKTGKAARDA